MHSYISWLQLLVNVPLTNLYATLDPFRYDIWNHGYVCMTIVHANLAKLIFMELLQQTSGQKNALAVFIWTNEHKWGKETLILWCKSSPSHSGFHLKDPHCTWFYRICDVIFEMMPAKSGALFRHEKPNLIYWHFLQKRDFAHYAKN